MCPVYFALPSCELLVAHPKKVFADFIDLVEDLLVLFESREEVNRLGRKDRFGEGCTSGLRKVFAVPG